MAINIIMFHLILYSMYLSFPGIFGFERHSRIFRFWFRRFRIVVGCCGSFGRFFYDVFSATGGCDSGEAAVGFFGGGDDFGVFLGWVVVF